MRVFASMVRGISNIFYALTSRLEYMEVFVKSIDGYRRTLLSCGIFSQSFLTIDDQIVKERIP